MKIVAAADHGGFEMKNQIVEDLRKQGFAVEDLGTNSADSVDYPDFAEKATAKVLAGQADLAYWSAAPESAFQLPPTGIRVSAPQSFMTIMLPRLPGNTTMRTFFVLAAVQ